MTAWWLVESAVCRPAGGLSEALPAIKQAAADFPGGRAFADDVGLVACGLMQPAG